MKKLIIMLVVLTMLYLLVFHIYSVLEASVMASLAVGQLSDSIVAYSAIQQLVVGGWLIKIITISYLVSMALTFYGFYPRKKREKEGGV